MEELLTSQGYIYSEEEREWNKDIWTIRLWVSKIEVFNTPRINTPGKYYMCPKTLENLQDILEAIDAL